MNFGLQLNPITYVAFSVLCIVLYLYYRQRSEHQRYLQGQPRQISQASFNDHQFVGSVPKLPTFSAQELEQRKPAREIDQSSISPRNFHGFAEFGPVKTVTNDSNQGFKSQNLGQTEKKFEGFRKNIPYDPVPRQEEPSSVFSHLGRHEPPTDFYYSQISPKRNIELREASPKNFDHPIINQTKPDSFRYEKSSSPKNLDIATAYKTYPNVDQEYKAFNQEFKQKEGNFFHEEGKKFDSPQRPGWRTSAFDRVGHSPDSPFKIFESNFVESNQKHLKPNAELMQLPKDQNIKKGSLSQIQEKRHPEKRATSQPIPTKFSKISAKVDRKSKGPQLFMAVNSDDEMTLEKEKNFERKDKRAGIRSPSLEDFEDGLKKGKRLRGNNFEEKSRIPEGRSFAEEGARGPIKKKPTADIAYLSEYGGNLSMKRYIEKKTMENTGKANQLSTSVSYARSFNPSVIEQETPPAKFQDLPKEDVPKPFTSLISNTGFINPPKKPALSSSSGFLFKKDQKPSGGTLFSSQRSTYETKQEDKVEIEQEKFLDPEKELAQDDDEVKKTETKAIIPSDLETESTKSAKIGNTLGSSLFSQAKSAGSNSTGLFVNASKETQKNERSSEEETEKVQPLTNAFLKPAQDASSILSSSGPDLFKTIRGPTGISKNEASEDKPKEDNQPLFKDLNHNKNESEKIYLPSDSMKSTPIFGSQIEETKKIETVQSKEPDTKSEAKSLFGAPTGIISSGGLFSDMLRKSSQPDLQKAESKTETVNKIETIGSGGLFGKPPGPMNSTPIASKPMFGNSIGKEDFDKNTSTVLDNEKDKVFFNNPSLVPPSHFQNKEKETSLESEKITKPSGLFGNTNFSASQKKIEDSTKDTSSPFAGFGSITGNDKSKPSSSLFKNGNSLKSPAGTNGNNEDKVENEKSEKKNQGTDGLFGNKSSTGSLFGNASGFGLFNSQSTGGFLKDNNKSGDMFSAKKESK